MEEPVAAGQPLIEVVVTAKEAVWAGVGVGGAEIQV